jgi:hypothetical protein
MKKILFTIVTLLTFVACVQEDIPSVYPSTGDGMVLVEASFTVPQMLETRSFADPAISSLHLLVFDENGFLIQVCNAEPVNSFGTETGVEYKYRVELGQSNYQRTIHLIANSPITINADGTSAYRLGEHERHVIDNLYTEGGDEAYWASVSLENGITGVQKIVDGKQVFEPSEELIEALTNVPMVRNYTRVKVTNNASAYLADAEIMMMNIPDRGSVAPRISDGNYAQFATHARAANSSLNYNDIAAQGYEGYEPNDMSLTNSTWGAMHEFYERRQQISGKEVATPAFAIVRGRYVGANGEDAEYSYYKIDICYTDKTTGAVELYNLLRNIEYNITIIEVLGRGYASLNEAATNAASNNLNFAVETKSLNSISDGERRLSVEYTQRVLTEGESLFTLKYKYETNIKTGATNNAAVTFSNLVGNVLAVNNASGTTDTQKYVVSNVAGADGWNTVTFKSQAISGTKIQTIILTAGNLQRSIELILGEPYTMTLDMVPGSSTNVVEREIGAAVEAKISLPLGLPEALFPLEIYLVAEEMTLSPDATKNVLPVITGLSATGVPSSSGIHFGYVVTIEASYYYVEDANGNRTGEYRNEKMLYFKTSTADSSSRVNIYNPYFNIAYDSFTAGN